MGSWSGSAASRTGGAMGSWEVRMVLEMKKELEAEDERLAVRRRMHLDGV